MADSKGSLQDQLYAVKRQLRTRRRVHIKLPAGFSFNRGGSKNFDPVVDFFDWSLKNCPVEIDFTGCSSANYQSLALLVPYCWHLRQAGCSISFIYDKKSEQSASHMWTIMGGRGVFQVLSDSTVNFKSANVKPLIAVRNPADMKTALESAVSYVARFGVEYQRTLRYVLAELLYNANEHGRRDFKWRNRRLITPAVLQFSWYEQANEIGIIVADIGVGIHAHLSQAYPSIANEEEALRLAVQPEISGTFGKHDPYSNRNNAGMGLFLSSSIVRRLRADMHIVSGNAVLHISPNDLTSHTLNSRWNGTFVYISMRLDQSYNFAYDQIMQELREEAKSEVSVRQKEESEHRHYLHIYNFFGKNAEDKQSAISYRNRHLLKAVDEGQVLVLDFEDVETSTHSFLNALLASPIRRMGMAAYKRIKITRALPDIRETLDYILDDNTSPDGADIAKYDDSDDQQTLF